MDQWTQHGGLPPGQGDAQGVQMATFWQRAGALLADGAILGILNGLLTSLTTGQEASSPLSIAVDMIRLVFSFAYFAWPYSHAGQTLGKQLLGIRVVPLDGSDLNWRHGILRTIGLILTDAFLGLGYLLCIKDKDKQAFHDKLAGTCVVKDTQPVRAFESPAEASRRQRRWLLATGSALALLVGCLALFAVAARPTVAQLFARNSDSSADRLHAALSQRWDPDDRIISAGWAFQKKMGGSVTDGIWAVIHVTYAARCDYAASNPCQVLANELAGIVIENYDQIEDLVGIEVSVLSSDSVDGTSVHKEFTVQDWRQQLSLPGPPAR